MADMTEVELFRTLVAKRLGLAFDDGKLGLLAGILRGRAQAAEGAHETTYLARLAADTGWRKEWRSLAEQLTVGETYFFRYLDHFRAFAEVVLPACEERRAPQRKIRILSAGCASGDEAYSLAILAVERFGGLARAEHVEILGIDVNPAALARAAAARYSDWSLRETPADLRARYFRAEGKNHVLEESVRLMVRFEERNLVEPDPGFWHPGSFDVVFCRNVTMYFPSETAKQIMALIAQALRPGGFLFLGHAETLRGTSSAFHLRHTHDTFYYQRKEANEVGSLVSVSLPWDQPVPADVRLSAAAPMDDSWFGAIQHASERVAALAGDSGAKRSHSRVRAAEVAGRQPQPAMAAPAWDLGVVIGLLREERFADAVRILDSLPAAVRDDLDAQVVRAAVLTNGGNPAAAREACERVLAADEFNAGAHYLLALCLEQAGDRKGAVEHNELSAHLDATFAMPRLRLGMLAKRAGQLDVARRELETALSLLPREDASRILLFGGGFDRHGLVDLCRGELRSCGRAS